MRYTIIIYMVVALLLSLALAAPITPESDLEDREVTAYEDEVARDDEVASKRAAEWVSTVL